MEAKSQWIIFAVLVFVLVCASLIIYSAKQKEYSHVLEYEAPNGQVFQIDNRSIGEVEQYYVHAIVDDVEYILPLRSDPWAVAGVAFEPHIEDKINRVGGISQLYLTQDPSLPEQTEQKSFIALLDFGKILGTNEYGIYKIPTRTAFTSSTEESLAYGLPVISCADVSDTVSVIELRLGDSNRVYSEGRCVIVQGEDTAGLILAADRLGYHLLGVM